MRRYKFKCHACKRSIIHAVDASNGVGYATRAFVGEDKIICYTCSGLAESFDMVASGRGRLHLVAAVRQHIHESPTGWYVTNWPGTLVIPVANIEYTGMYRAVSFAGPEGREWQGTVIIGVEQFNVRRTDKQVLSKMPTREDYITTYPYEESKA